MKGRYADCGPVFARIGRSLGVICGKPLMLHYDTEYREEDADFEPCMPVRNGKPVDGISIRQLPAAACVSLFIKGRTTSLASRMPRSSTTSAPRATSTAGRRPARSTTKGPG